MTAVLRTHKPQFTTNTSETFDLVIFVLCLDKLASFVVQIIVARDYLSRLVINQHYAYGNVRCGEP